MDESAADRAGVGKSAVDRAGPGESAADRADAGGSAVEAFTSATGLPASPVAAPPPWQGVINGILYTLIFSHALDDAEVDRVAALIVEQRSLPGGPARHRAAIRAGTGVSGHPRRLITDAVQRARFPGLPDPPAAQAR